MDLQKAKILLKKINVLHKSMGADKEHITPIEKDLMLDYVRQLYDIFLEQTPVPKRATEPKPEIIEPAPCPEPKKEVPQKTSSSEPELAQTEEIKETPASAKSYNAPRLIELSDSLKQFAESEAAVSDAKTPSRSAKPKVDDEELESLFKIPKAKELSDKLSAMPIKDLKKAMGINERIFTINELFGGEKPVYDEVIDTLNNLDNFEQAKAYLINHVSIKYKWTAKGKKKKATNFIKLVRRRFN